MKKKIVEDLIPGKKSRGRLHARRTGKDIQLDHGTRPQWPGFVRQTRKVNSRARSSLVSPRRLFRETPPPGTGPLAK